MSKKQIQIKRTIGKTFEGTPVRKSFYGKNKREAESKYAEYIKQMD
ncbi:MAG: hypothetical protein ACRCU3_09525 [Eubacteriaceae bacterium]